MTCWRCPTCNQIFCAPITECPVCPPPKRITVSLLFHDHVTSVEVQCTPKELSFLYHLAASLLRESIKPDTPWMHIEEKEADE